jgi:TIR domain-containing protein
LSQVFVSYKREEIEFAQRLTTKLTSEGFNVWMDDRIPAGTEWREEVDGEIRKSIALILIMTAAAKASEYVTYEWAFAYGAGVRVIPLIFIEPEKLHPRLSTLQYRDFRNTEPWSELVNDLRDAESSQLTIHHAVWGAKNKMNSVTRDVKKKVSAGALDMIANIEILGEPADGDRKKLIVIYSYAGNLDCEEVEEDGRLMLPNLSR